MNRDEKILKRAPGWRLSLAAKLGIRLDATATSKSGRWIVLLGEHIDQSSCKCFDVIAVNTDLQVSRQHFGTLLGDHCSASEAESAACSQAREAYELLVHRLQDLGHVESEGEAAAQLEGLVTYNPDGTEEQFKIN